MHYRQSYRPEPPPTRRLPQPRVAIVVGAAGGIGGALHGRLSTQSRFRIVLGLGRRSSPPLDLTDEASIAEAARHAASLARPQAARELADAVMEAAARTATHQESR